MKKIMSILLATIFIYQCSDPLTKSNDEQEYSIPTNGLMVYFPFNGNANDSSGHNMHGEALGATLTKDRNGVHESAYYFDGVDDYIRVENSSILDLTSSLTISVWAKGVAASSMMEVSICGLVSKGAVQPYGIGLDDGDRVVFRIVSSNNWYEVLKTDLAIDKIQWYHYVGVFEAGKSVQLYLNGEELIRNDSSIPEKIDNSDYDLWIGTRAEGEFPYSPKYYFNGVIDEVRIYNRGLSIKEIRSLYNLYN